MGNKLDGTRMNVPYIYEAAGGRNTSLVVREKPNGLYVWGFLWHTLLTGLWIRLIPDRLSCYISAKSGGEFSEFLFLENVLFLTNEFCKCIYEVRGQIRCCYNLSQVHWFQKCIADLHQMTVWTSEQCHIYEIILNKTGLSPQLGKPLSPFFLWKACTWAFHNILKDFKVPEAFLLFWVLRRLVPRNSQRRRLLKPSLLKLGEPVF